MFILLILISACTTRFVTETPGPVRNVVLIIGDGMGLSHIYSAMSVYDGELNMAKAKHIGFSKTHSFDNYNTDSAAGGTAISSGVKTRNGMIGMSPDTVNVKTMIEWVHEKGLAGGVVSTSAVTHATPASFLSHNISRENYEELAEDFLKTQPEVFIGGGLSNFVNRQDSVNLIPELQESGYQIVYTIEDLLKADANKLAGLLADEHLPKMSEGRGDLLAYSSIKALQTLRKNKKGFFLMIEGSQIDWAAHDHDTRYLIEETLDLDMTLGVVLDFAEQNGKTLVIVTADHETGGMTLVGGDPTKRSVAASYSTGRHTGIVVPVFAFGPGAGLFNGFYDNTEIFEKIRFLLRL